MNAKLENLYAQKKDIKAQIRVLKDQIAEELCIEVDWNTVTAVALDFRNWIVYEYSGSDSEGYYLCNGGDECGSSVCGIPASLRIFETLDGEFGYPDFIKCEVCESNGMFDIDVLLDETEYDDSEGPFKLDPRDLCSDTIAMIRAKKKGV